MDDLWQIERSLWLDGVEAYRAHMAGQCLMAFGPVGTMANAAILSSLEHAPRWSSVAFASQIAIRPGDVLAVLSYEALAERAGAPPYRALCTSTYLRQPQGWKIVQHQQTQLS